MAILNVKDFGARGNGLDDDTVAIASAISYASNYTQKYQAALWFPSGMYLISDGKTKLDGTTNQNQQAITITGATGTQFTLTVTIGAPPPSGGVVTQTTAPIANSSSGATTAASIQTQLQALTAIGTGNATVVYDSANQRYLVTFSPSLGSPVMSGVGSGLLIITTVLQSGAGLVIPNMYGLRLFGDGTALADYDQPAGPLYAPASRAALVWNGTANGVMLHLAGCNNTTLENLALWGGTAASASSQARTGLLLSPNLLNPVASQGGTGLTCRSCVFTRLGTTAASSTVVSGCVQLGMNENDGACDATEYEACTFGPGTNGLLVVGSQSVNHNLRSCTAKGLGIGAWFQQGGNLLWDGCRAEASGVSTLLKLGPGTEGVAYGYYAGGVNASTFLLRNVRTNPTTGPNLTVVDATWAGPGTQVMIDGWDDSMANTSDSTPAVLLGEGTSVNVRHSLVSRSVLATEGTPTPPSSTFPAALRLENLIVPEYTLAAALCPSLSSNTKVDVVSERTSIYNTIRPDTSTAVGRPRYSPVNWLIQQQKPKYFYDLGDIGLLAPNQGWNLYMPGSPPRTDAMYVMPVSQNVQGIIQTDAVGGFNTRGPGSSTPTGYVSLVRFGGFGLGPVAGKGWTLLAVAMRNAAPAGQTQWIISNLGTTPASGGLELSIDDTNGSKVTFTTYDGTNSKVVVGTTAFSSTGVPIYIMVQVDTSGSIALYVQGRTSADQTGTGGTYLDSTLVPVIGHSGHGSGVSDLQIARVATFDSLIPLSAWNSIYVYGTQFMGR